MYRTESKVVEAEDGTQFTLVYPIDCPDNKRADELRKLWSEHVVPLTEHWKGPVEAVVKPSLVEDVSEAMDFMGAIVDKISETCDGMVKLYSKGYWAHGF
jgi:hypothetical protein